MACMTSCTPSTDDLSISEPQRPITTEEALEKLLDRFQENSITLRNVFAYPKGVVAEDIFVDVTLALERGKGDPVRPALAEKAKKRILGQLTSLYCATKEKALLELHVYIADISVGDAQTRLQAADGGQGLIRVCLVWITTEPANKKDGLPLRVYDGARIVMTDTNGYGLYDVLWIRGGEECATRTLPDQIIKKVRR
jgi:hypothetical protein